MDCTITRQNEGLPCLVRRHYEIYILPAIPNSLPQVNFELVEDVTGPLYVYYELQNFYQNHRRYVKSRSAYQLQGQVRNLWLHSNF